MEIGLEPISFSSRQLKLPCSENCFDVFEARCRCQNEASSLVSMKHLRPDGECVDVAQAGLLVQGDVILQSLTPA